MLSALIHLENEEMHVGLFSLACPSLCFCRLFSPQIHSRHQSSPSAALLTSHQCLTDALKALPECVPTCSHGLKACGRFKHTTRQWCMHVFAWLYCKWAAVAALSSQIAHTYTVCCIYRHCRWPLTTQCPLRQGCTLGIDSRSVVLTIVPSTPPMWIEL